jgi:hypothetical protein
MSIIIVGVGDADFEAMNELDSDDKLLRHYNQVAERDIVQFVPMRDFNHSRANFLQKAHLAKEVLAEVPEQVVGYMRKIKVKPSDIPPPPTQQVQGERFNPDGPSLATAPPITSYGNSQGNMGRPQEAPPPYQPGWQQQGTPVYAQPGRPGAPGYPPPGGAPPGYGSPYGQQQPYGAYASPPGGYNMYQQR